MIDLRNKRKVDVRMQTRLTKEWSHNIGVSMWTITYNFIICVGYLGYLFLIFLKTGKRILDTGVHN